LSRWIVAELGPDVPVHFTAFHPDWKMRDTPHTPHETLIRARTIARAEGVRHVYTGNVSDKTRQSTWCSVCGARVIGRDGYRITDWTLDRAGCCSACGTQLPGRFESRPGEWGARRLPVRIGSIRQ
jgi:pyruvate formate lyase activating enzyme